MILRKMATKDLEECLGVSTARIGQEIVGYQRALSAWEVIVKSAAFNSVVIETAQPIAGHRIVAFGASVFVSPEFASRELSNPRPGLNERIISSIDAGQSVVLTEAELRHQNTYGGLCQAILYSSWRPDCLTPEQITEVQLNLAKRYAELHSGYRLERMLVEAVDAIDIEYAKSTRVWQIISDFSDFHSKNPGNTWNLERALAVIERTSALSVVGSIASLFFHYTPPVLRFRNGDQQLLEAALEGLTDHELAQALSLNIQTVKKRWASVFDQVADVMPGLLPESDDDAYRETRGPQKRHHLLAYLRRHPEELRPFIR